MTVSLSHYIIVSGIIFIIGIFGLFNGRRNIISILLAIELLLLSVNINFVAFSIFLNDLTGQIFSLFVLAVAAAESAIGLAILVVYYRNRGSIEIEDASAMSG